MKQILRLMVVLIVAGTMLSSCGYHNPYVYSGPERTIYATTWKNRTQVLLLDSKIYQSLIKWYQKSGSLKISKQKEGADFILAGEIISIDLPSLTYGAANTASEVNIKLKVRYILKDLNSGATLIEQPSETWTEEYKVSTSSAQTKNNENEALAIIIDELSQKIYQRSLMEFAKL